MQFSLAELAADNLQLWVNASGIMVDTVLASDHWIVREAKPRGDGRPSTLPSAVLRTIFYAILEPCFTVALLWLSAPPWILVIASILPQGSSVTITGFSLTLAVAVDRGCLNNKPATERSKNEKRPNGWWWNRLGPSDLTSDGRSFFIPVAISAYANACLLLFSQNTASAFDRRPVMVGLGYFALVVFCTASAWKTWEIKRIIPMQSSNNIPHFRDQVGLQLLQFVTKMLLRMALGLDPLMAYRKVDATKAEDLFGDARYKWIDHYRLEMPWYFALASSGLSVVFSLFGAWYLGRHYEQRFDDLVAAADERITLPEG